LKAHRAQVLDTPITLGNTTVNVTLQPDAAPPVESNDSVGAANESDGHTYLVLEDVTLVGLPALTYKVFITNKRNPKKSSYIATFSFFGTGPAHEGHGDGNSLGDLVYQVSGNLAELGIESADDIGIRFEPTNLLVGQKLRAQAAGNGVKVGRIRLKTSADAP
jgi:hypothetical protein